MMSSLVAPLVKNAPAVQETWVRSLGWEDSLKKEMATHSSILAGKIPWTEERASCGLWGHRELDTTEVTEHANMQSPSGDPSQD